jgi:hypothetical protein
MAQVKRFKAKKPFKLDCGHEVRVGDSFVVTKVFACEADAKRIPFGTVQPAPSQK